VIAYYVAHSNIYYV